MPAILPARLKIQVIELTARFEQPAALVRALHDLLNQYADRTHRAGQSGAPRSLLVSYQSPPPVLRQVQAALRPLVQGDAAAGLALCDALWAEEYLEFRRLAAGLLGFVPAPPAAPVLERVRRWGAACADDSLLELLLDDGLARLRQAAQADTIELINGWLGSSQRLARQAGLRALRSLIEDPSFENLPAAFRLATPLLRQSPPGLRSEVLALAEALVRRSPSEAAYILRQNLTTPESADAAWLLRNTLEYFPPNLQESLRAAARLAARR